MLRSYSLLPIQTKFRPTIEEMEKSYQLGKMKRDEFPNNNRNPRLWSSKKKKKKQKPSVCYWTWRSIVFIRFSTRESRDRSGERREFLEEKGRERAAWQRRWNDNRAERRGKETERERDCWGASKDFEILFPPGMAPPRWPRYLRGGVQECRNYLQSVTGLRTEPAAPPPGHSSLLFLSFLVCLFVTRARMPPSSARIFVQD